MTINIKTDKKGYFLRYYELMNPFFNLPPLERRALALIAEEYWINYEAIGKEDIAWRLSMDYDAKMRVRESLGDISFNSHANILTSLRKRGVIVDNRIVHPYLIGNSKDTTLTFKFTINEEGPDNKKHS